MQGFNNQVVCGDCELVLKNYPDKQFQNIITSPPYADIKDKYLNGFKGVAPELYSNWFIPKAKEFFRVLKDDGSFVLNIDSKVQDGFESIYVYELVTRLVNEVGFKLFDTLFWDKGKFLPIRNRFGNRVEFLFIFVKQRDFKFKIDEFRNEYAEISIRRMKSPIKKRFARTEENQKLDNYKAWQPNPKGALPGNIIEIGSESQRVCDNHVACFPVKLPERFILGLTDENDIVLDPFSGTGSTLYAAKKNNRKFLGIDISMEYVEFSLGRLSNI